MQKKDTFFITTPIYYTNWVPHIGNSYSSIIADLIARYNKISGKKVKFSTWVDENSQKALNKACEQNMEIKPYLDMMALKHKEIWNWLKIEYTDFIRTTDEKHHNLVKEVLQKSFDNWDIYEWEYEGMYCVWCEAFKKDEDLVYLNKEKNVTFPISDKVKINENIIKVCPDHLKTPDKIKEKNYFFKLSKYENFLKEFYETHPDFIIPSDRFNEVKAFVSRWLEDFSISRETNKFWIKLPFDESQVTYVWYDALFNYLTVCQNWNEDFWPANLHVVGKDIIRFHGIYWPAMLKSAWYELPKQILTTGFFTINWQKISKSLWNAIDPVEFTKKYSKDLLTLYLLSSFNIWQDWDFDEKQAVLAYNAKLANNLWNLLNRVVVLSLKLSEKAWELFWEILTDKEEIVDLQKINNWLSKKVVLQEFEENMDKYDLKKSLEINFFTLDLLNDFITKSEPWQTIKQEEKTEETRQVLYIVAEWLRQVWLNLYTFFPEKITEMFEKLWLKNYKNILENWWFEELKNKVEIFKIIEKGNPLFERIEITKN